MSKDQNKTTTLLAVGAATLIAVIGIGAAVYALTLDTSSEQSTHATETTHEHSEASGHPKADDKRASAPSAEEVKITIVFGDNGFEQPSYTVKSGETVLVKNTSNEEFYFTTGDHHNHDINSPLNLGTIEPGGASSFVAPAPGTYTFHNHDNDAQAGELIVQ